MPTKMTPEEMLAAELASGAHKCEFTEVEFAALRDMASVYLGLKQFGRVAVLVQRIMKFIGSLVIMYLAFKAGLVEWVRNAVGK